MIYPKIEKLKQIDSTLSRLRGRGRFCLRNHLLKNQVLLQLDNSCKKDNGYEKLQASVCKTGLKAFS